MNWTDFQQVVLWLAGVGAPILVMYILSWVVENWKAWSTFPKNVKFLTPMVASVLLSLGASQLLKYPAVISSIQPWFQVTMTSILAYLASQKAYITAMTKGYGARFARPTSKNVQVFQQEDIK
jgi:chromate transport protein ChrA